MSCSVEDVKARLDAYIEKWNANPTKENYKDVEVEWDFYSDIFKDEFGSRPRFVGEQIEHWDEYSHFRNIVSIQELYGIK